MHCFLTKTALLGHMLLKVLIPNDLLLTLLSTIMTAKFESYSNLVPNGQNFMEL